MGRARIDTQRRQPLLLVRHWRFLSPGARLKLRLHRMRTGNVFLADADLLAVVAYGVRIITLPFAIAADWLAVPLLRVLDRDRDSWWVVEVRFAGWDAEFVRIAQARSEAEANNLFRSARRSAARRPGNLD